MDTIIAPATDRTNSRLPLWAVLDDEGVGNGPNVYFGKLGVMSGWTPEEGAIMWLDTIATRDGFDLTTEQARALAATLVQFADLIDSAAAL